MITSQSLSFKWKIAWRFLLVTTIVIQLICFQRKSQNIKNYFNIPIELESCKNVLKKEANTKIFKLCIFFFSIIIAIPLVLIVQTYITLNASENIPDDTIEKFVFIKFDNDVLAALVNVYKLINFIHSLVNLFGIPVLIIFQMLLIEIYLKHVIQLIKNARRMNNIRFFENDIEMFEEGRRIKHAIVIHQYASK
jgi:hypothetical protein